MIDCWVYQAALTSALHSFSSQTFTWQPRACRAGQSSSSKSGMRTSSADTSCVSYSILAWDTTTLLYPTPSPSPTSSLSPTSLLSLSPYLYLCLSPTFTLSLPLTLSPDGSGFCHVPTTPSMHELQCATWKPTGSFKDQFTCERFFFNSIVLPVTVPLSMFSV